MNKAVVAIDITAREQEAIQHNDRIVDLRKIMEQSFLEMAEHLYEMQNKAYYKELGFDHFEQYLKSPDVDIPYRTANRLIDVHSTFVLKYKVDKPLLLSAGYSKLYLVRNQVNEENLGEWVQKAIACPRKDLEAEVSVHGDQSLEVPEYYNLEALARRAMKFILEDMWQADDIRFVIQNNAKTLDEFEYLQKEFEKAQKVKRL